MVTKAYLANGKDGYDVLAKCKQVRYSLYVLNREALLKGKDRYVDLLVLSSLHRQLFI
jgi:hypothetical protein